MQMKTFIFDSKRFYLYKSNKGNSFFGVKQEDHDQINLKNYDLKTQTFVPDNLTIDCYPFYQKSQNVYHINESSKIELPISEVDVVFIDGTQNG